MRREIHRQHVINLVLSHDFSSSTEMLRMRERKQKINLNEHFAGDCKHHERIANYAAS
jgi:hypothetical protein